MSNILTGFNMQGNDPIDDRIVSKSNLETLEQYLKRVPVQKRYYGLTFFALDKNNELRKYTFQTSLIEPTIDDDEEEIERIDKELQEHVSNKAIHKTSEEIRSEIVDADIPDTIARVQWTLDQINTAVINLIGGASDEYNTLKRIQTKIEELRAKIYGDDGGEVLKTLEQALKFLNQYKDFIVDIPDNFVSKQDIVDNLTTDDPTKVLSAKQGKVLSDTLTNYFESAMQSIRTETDRAINAENRIETKLDKEIDRSIKEDQRIDAKLDAEIKRSTDEDLRIDSKLDSEINRSTTEDDRLDKKIDAETTRATTVESNLNTKIETETDRAESEESRIETKLDNEIARSTNKDTEHDNRLTALEGDTHEQNTDLGTTNSTFQLKYNTGNKIKHESDAISVRNAADTDYVNFIAKNATFKGDLLVEGQSFVTEAETVEIKDNLLLLNKGEVGAGVTKGIAGLEIDRGTEPNYQIIFDESDNRFKAGEIGDIQCLALRDGDDSMTGGMFTSWDSTTKRLKTTNIVPSSSFLYFGDNKTVSLNYSPANDGSLTINTNNQYLAIFTGDNYTNFRSTRNKFQFIGDLYTTGTKYALTFKRGSDNSEVLYHADIVNNLTSGGTNKVLSAEQGKLLQNSITSIQGSYLPLSGGTMTGSIIFPNRKGIFGRLTDGTGNIKIAVVNANNNVEIGNSNTPLMLVSNSTDLTHYRDNNTYKIWDKFNLSDPATLSGNNTFTGSNIFSKTLKIGSQSTYSEINSDIGVSYHYEIDTSVSRGYRIVLGNSIKYDFRFGGMFNGNLDTPDMYSYITTGQNTYITTPYKFYSNKFSVSNTMIVPESSFRIYTGNMTLLYYNQSEKKVQFGSSDSSVSLELMANNLYHTKYDSASSTWKKYIIYSEYNLPTPASTTDLANYLPLIGGTLTGQLTIKQSVDIKLRLQSTDADNHCIIQAINAQASQLGVFGYAGDKWAIGHNGTYYEIWDKYNLTNPVTYTTNTYNHATLTNKDGQYFTYIKAGTNGLLPHSKATLTSGGSGSLGTSDQSFNAAYINNLHTNKVTFGDAGPYITGSTSATQFLNAEGGVQKVATGGLYVGPSYASDALALVPSNGIYSQGNIRTSGWLTFEDNEWTDTGWAYKDAKGSIKVLSVINETNNKPTSYGSVLQFNSRQGHWCTQIWCDQTNAAGVIGTLRFRTTKSYASTEWNPWTSLVTEFDLNSYLTKTEASTLYYPYNGRGYLSITSSGRPVMSNNQGYAVKDKDGNEKEVLWMGTDNVLNLGNTSQYTLGQLNLRCTTLTHNGNSIATQNYVTNQLGNYLPLTGGIVTGDIKLNTEAALYTAASSGSGYSYYKTISYDNDKGIILGASNTSIKIQSSNPRIYHIYKGTEYEIYSTNNLPAPVFAPGKIAGSLTPIYNNFFYINDSSYKVATIDNSYSFPKIYSPTTAGTAGQILQSTGGVPTWVDASSVVGNFVSKSGDTMTGALTMNSRRNNIVVDVVGGAGQSWNKGAGALSVQVPSDSGQTPLILARRSGAAINTTTLSERLLDMALSDNGTFFRVNMSGVNALELEVTSFTNKVGIGKLFGKQIATTDQIPSIPSISISNSGSGNAVTAISASGHTLTVTKGATYLTSSALSGYATQSWANSQFAPLKNYFVTSNYASIATTGNEMCIGSLTSGNSIINVNYRNGTGTTSPSTWYWRAGSSTSWANAYWGNLYMNDNLVATQTWSNSQYPLKTGAGASGTWDINISGNASTASAASKLGSTTIGGSAKPIYLSSGTPTACSATVGSATVPVYMNAGTITQCSTTLGVSITGNAATATNATQLGGTAASSYVKANDNISRLTNDSGYTTQEWVNGQGFLTSDSILDKFVPTTGGYIRNSDQVLFRLQRTGVSTGTSRTIEMYFDDSNTDGTSTTPRGSIGYSSEVGMFLYSAKSKKFLAMENTGRPFYGTPENRYYLLGSNTEYHNLDGYQRIGDIMIQWGYFTVQGNSTRAVNFPVSFTNTVWSVTGSWDNTTTGNQENWGFTDYTSSGFTIINGDGSSRVFHYIAIGPFTRS